ncbi:MAG: VWA domain-containing protein, partial [Alphaproteobacteria bacterium]|nr:VWA domain-containing protein [Alphaproteobacteria bacterium]
AEFKHMEYFYFHNFLYEGVWKDNYRRHSDKLSTSEVINTYGPDYKVVIVGDATMSPYEIVYPGGSVEHWNEESGQVWLERLIAQYKHAVWLNPVPERHWDYTPSVQMTHQLMEGRMYGLTLDGLDKAMRELNR